ncbi:hypothetical protein L288_19550 [Sphingobium quisquiliarum P25]|uniref:Uncharacterized protein n=1 Tax=Sphingobium quisquiliarum P25 TaxID=1329909 RepID=T0G6U6_9SPHN|nr:hypothetical protein L288_19550 [Sphingobium quisquiliarum P25]
MLHDIAVGPFAEQPAGKIAPPLAIGAAAHVQLNESAGFLHIFPGRGRLAGLQADDGVAHTQRFARFHRQVAGQAVSLVEQADHGDPLTHGRAGQGRIFAVADRGAFDAHRSGLVRGGDIVIAAARQKQGAAEQWQAGQDRQERPRPAQGHDASGLHAS